MELGPPSVSASRVMEDPPMCSECGAVSRLTNGLCLNCLLRGALNEETPQSGRDAFKQVLSAVKSRDGDWHIADHEVVHEIARGGMGVVYQAREPHSERLVALKCVLAYQGDSDQVVARFRREAETAAGLDHPNIVPIYRIGETADGFPYYTMKYAPGGSLLEARGPLGQDPRQSVELMLKVTRAVQYAHENGVLHRDLKPGNILLDHRGEPLVSDFGLARSEAASSYLTLSLSSFGTPGYIAPEQADGPASNLTPAADVYSLGAILFELLTGRTPFVGENAFAVMKQSADEPAPKVRSLSPRVDRDLEKICERCLEREPTDRYQTAAALANDLEHWLAGEPISAGPVGFGRHVGRVLHRHRKLAAGLSLFVLGAGILVGWHTHLQTSMHESMVASRSVVVLPFLDLERIAADDSLPRAIASSLAQQFRSFGPARVEIADRGSPVTWSGNGSIPVGARNATSRTVLTGTVRRVPNGERISLRLLNRANADVLFSKVWLLQAVDERRVSDEVARIFYTILSSQDWSEIARARMDPGLENLEARDAIIAGRNLMNNGATSAHCDGAITLFQRAVAIEPNSVTAHVNVSYAAAGRTHYNSDTSFLILAEDEARKALALATDSGEAHRAIAAVHFQKGHFYEALEEQLQSIEFGGLDEKISNFIGETFQALGRPHHALKWCQFPLRAVRTPGRVEWMIGDCWTKLADDERALAAFHRSADLGPDMPDGQVGISHVLLLQGNFNGARTALQTLRFRSDIGESDKLVAEIEFFARDFAKAEQLYQQLAGSDRWGGGQFWGAVTYQSALARIRQEQGRQREAEELLEQCLARQKAILADEPLNPEAAYRVGAIEAMMGRPEAALHNLRRAIDLGWLDYRSPTLDPRFDSLRSLPEFAQIMNTISDTVRRMRAEAQQLTN